MFIIINIIIMWIFFHAMLIVTIHSTKRFPHNKPRFILRRTKAHGGCHLDKATAACEN